MKKLVILSALAFCVLSIKIFSNPEHKKVDAIIVSAPVGFCNISDSITLKYIRSLAAGALVGMGTGIVTAYSDTIAPNWWPITWFLAMNARCDLVNSIGNDMSAHEVGYHDGIMRLSALVASWVAWYKTYCYLNGASPFAKS